MCVSVFQGSLLVIVIMIDGSSRIQYGLNRTVSLISLYCYFLLFGLYCHFSSFDLFSEFWRDLGIFLKFQPV